MPSAIGMIFPDDRTLQHIAMMRPPEEERAADTKSLELLRNSPYKDRLATVGLFMAQLDRSRPALPKLIRGQVGNTLVLDLKAPRLASLISNAPKLEQTKVDQIAALPLGGRIKVDPWTGRVDINRARPVALINAHEKMPFEVTPSFPYVTRLQTSQSVTQSPAISTKNTNSGQ